MKFKILAACIGAAALVMVGCKSNPVYNVTDAPVTTSSNRYASQDVRSAILQAGASLGWQMKEVRAGLIAGTLNVRDHMARIDIEYNRKSYSIQYRDSQNLNYDGTSIHSNYNGWIQRLQGAINARISQI